MACVLGLCPLGASVKEQMDQVVLFHLGLEQGQAGDGRRHCVWLSLCRAVQHTWHLGAPYVL